jgi:hypothetical protein
MNTTVHLNPELINLAKEMGLNISKTCENALKSATSCYKKQILKQSMPPQFEANFGMVDRAGFEPASNSLSNFSGVFCSFILIPVLLLLMASYKFLD